MKQGKLNLPVRKTRSNAVTKHVEVEDISPREETVRTSSRFKVKMLQPVSDTEALVRTPRSRRKAAAAPAIPNKGPLKRPVTGGGELQEAILLSPSKQLEDLLCSPKAQVKAQPEPAPRSRTPAKSPSRQSDVPTPTATLFPSNSPRRITTKQLEEIICSPVKSPKKLSNQSPRKPLTPVKHCTPVKNMALFSPVKSATTHPKSASLLQADVTQFQQARAALHTGTPNHLLCREEQVDIMSKWLDTHLVQGKSGSMYMSGAPGTGKTVALTHLLNTKTVDYKSIFINCMVLKSSIAIYREVAKQLAPKQTPKTERDALKAIKTAITTSKKMTLLVLDEVDQLDSKNQSVLYTVFEWPALEFSTLALVGIANSLDLTNRMLPRLKSYPVKPTLLNYPPYTKVQIIEIITARLKEGDTGEHPVITPRAIAYLAGKISSLSGDIRMALDVCRRALELAETLARKQTLLKPMTPRDMDSPTQSPRKGYKNPKVTQVDVPQIMKVVNQVYGSQVTASLGTKGEGLPIKQKILIASLLLMVKKGKRKEITLGKLADTYSKILKKRQMEPEHESACVGKRSF